MRRPVLCSYWVTAALCLLAPSVLAVRLSCSPHDVLLLVGGETEVSLLLEAFEGTAMLFPHYEPPSAAQKIVALGNVTVDGRGRPVNVSVSIHALRGGHVTVSWNTTPDRIITNDEAYVRVTNIHSHEVLLVCVVVGWIYFAAWSVSFYPQVYVNWRRKCVVGLNLDFVALNVLGHSVYALFNMGLYWLPSVQQQYFELYPMGVIPVQTNDVVFSVHATVLSLVTGVQCLVYERGSQRVWPGSWALIGLSTALVLCSCAAAAASALTWLSVLYYCSYVKLAVTLVKYVPQAYMNYARQSTVGFSIGGVLLDMTGGLLSILQMLLLAFNNDDWDSIFGDPTKFGLGLFSVLFDLLFAVQHYVLYRSSGEPHVLLVNSEDPPRPDPPPIMA